MYMDEVGGVDIRPENIESHFWRSIVSLCEEDPQFKAALMSTGSDLGLVENDIGCIKWRIIRVVIYGIYLRIF